AQYLGRTSAGNDGSKLSPELYPARHFIDQLSHRHGADFDLEVTGADDIAADADNPRAGIAGPAESRIFRAAHRDHMLHMTERLDGIDNGRAQIETKHRGKLRWFDRRLGALALQRLHEHRL